MKMILSTNSNPYKHLTNPFSRWQSNHVSCLQNPNHPAHLRPRIRTVPAGNPLPPNQQLQPRQSAPVRCAAPSPTPATRPTGTRTSLPNLRHGTHGRCRQLPNANDDENQATSAPLWFYHVRQTNHYNPANPRPCAAPLAFLPRDIITGS